jgi:hypothetical protein
MTEIIDIGRTSLQHRRRESLSKLEMIIFWDSACVRGNGVGSNATTPKPSDRVRANSSGAKLSIITAKEWIWHVIWLSL